ncbi:MAG: hypothetical protein LBG96_16450 [Tannerella sp.]|jgi:hypothetical protein|nr:hypothetical protein [Tannerella sp.]
MKLSHHRRTNLYSELNLKQYTINRWSDIRPALALFVGISGGLGAIENKNIP